MKKLFILLLLLISSLFSYSQITCPPNVPEFSFYYTIPLANNQVIDSVNYCDPEGQSVQWSIPVGNELNIWAINDGIISVVDATIVNNNPNIISYTFTIQVLDPGNLSNTSIIHLIEINSPPVIISY